MSQRFTMEQVDALLKRGAAKQNPRLAAELARPARGPHDLLANQNAKEGRSLAAEPPKATAASKPGQPVNQFRDVTASGVHLHGYGECNKTEKRFADEILMPELGGRWLKIWCQAIKFRVGQDTCFYLPDFVATDKDGRMHAFEVKGPAVKDSSVIKFKACKLEFVGVTWHWCIQLKKGEPWQINNRAKTVRFTASGQ